MNMRNILLMMGLSALLMVQACESDSKVTTAHQVDPGQRKSNNLNDHTTTSDLHQTGGHSAEGAHAATAAYICPMNCEGSASDKPGKCPVCKMDLVKNKNHAAGNAHEVDNTSEHNNEVLNHESEPEDDQNLDDKVEQQPAH